MKKNNLFENQGDGVVGMEDWSEEAIISEPGGDNALTEAGREKYCTPAEAGDLVDQGWGAVDMHVHTWHSYDVLPVKAHDPLMLYEKARKKGFRFITFTDHDTMDAYDQVGWTREGIVPGVEIKILDPKRVGHTLHINVYELNKKQFLELEDIAAKDKNLETFLQYLWDHRLNYTYNHPFWHEGAEKPNIQAIFEIAPLFPVIEYNMGRVSLLNQQAMRLAEFTGAGVAAGTDTHIGCIGFTYTLAQGETFKEFFQQIKAGCSYIVPRDMNPTRFTYEAAARLKNLFEKERWLFEKPSFHINAGIRFVDRLVEKLVRSESQGKFGVKKILQYIMEGILQTGIPASLYIKSQQALGARVYQAFSRITQPAREMQEVINSELQKTGVLAGWV